MPPQISAAAHPIVLRGVEYRLAPLEDHQIDEVNNWLRSQMIRMARESLGGVSDQEARDEVLGAAIREANKLDFMVGRGFRELVNRNGIAQLLWQSLHREHPTITHDAVKQLLSTDDGKLDANTVSLFAKMFADMNISLTKKKEPPQENGAPKVENES